MGFNGFKMFLKVSIALVIIMTFIGGSCFFLTYDVYG